RTYTGAPRRSRSWRSLWARRLTPRQSYCSCWRPDSFRPILCQTFRLKFCETKGAVQITATVPSVYRTFPNPAKEAWTASTPVDRTHLRQHSWVLRSHRDQSSERLSDDEYRQAPFCAARGSHAQNSYDGIYPARPEWGAGLN